MELNSTLVWLQNEEALSGGVNGDNTGVLNRPLISLLENDIQLSLYKTTAVLPFIAGEITAMYKVCIQGTNGKMMIADYTNVKVLTDFIAIALNAVDQNALGLYRVMDSVTNSAWTLTVGSPVYIGASGAITQTLPSGPNYPRLIGHAISATTIYLK